MKPFSRLALALFGASLLAACVSGPKARFYALDGRGIAVAAMPGDLQPGDRRFDLLSTSWSWSPSYAPEGAGALGEESIAVTDDASLGFRLQLERQAIGAGRISLGRMEFRARLLLGPLVALSEVFLFAEGGAGGTGGRP